MRLLGTIAALGLIFALWASTRSLWASALIGLASALAYFSMTVHWLGAAADPDPATYSLRQLVMAFGGLWLFVPWWLIWMIAARALAGPEPSRLGAWSSFIGTFSLTNIALGDLVMGIPMAPLSLTVLDTGLSWLFSVIGQFGVDTLIVTLSSLLALCCMSRRFSSAIMLTAAIIAASIYTIPSTAPQSSPKASAAQISVIQPNLPHISLLDPLRSGEIILDAALAAVSAAADDGASLIVLPESAIPNDLTAEPELVARFAALLPDETSLVIGFTRVEAVTDAAGSFAVHPYNSAAIITKSGIAAVYDKAHLVPFGETMPALFFKLGFDVVAAPSGGLRSGPGLQSFPAPAGSTSYLLAICYEAMLPGAVSREIGTAEWVLNISAEAMFRGTVGPYLTLQQTRIRAIETGRPVIRSTAHAYSGLVGPDGSLISIAADDEYSLLALDVPASVPTVFAALGKYAFTPLYLLTATLLFSAVMSRISRKTRLSGQREIDLIL